MINHTYRFRSGSFLFLILSILLFTFSASAQTSRGSVAGTVKDQQDAVVVGAKVDLTNKSTGVVRSAQTNEVGAYRFDAVDLGDYDLKISNSGFKDFVNKGIGIVANRTATIDAKLEVGGGETVIEVNTTAEDLIIRDAPIRGGTFDSKEVSNLPIASLNPIALARILPGVVLPSGSSTFGNGGSATQFAVNGQRPRGNNYLLDGTENNDISVGGNAQAFNITDAVQEVSVQTSNYGVEFGRAGGGVFNVITKGGGNQYHGTASWLLLSNAFNAVTNTNKLNGITKPAVFTENIYGFTAGGPIKKDRTFIFGAFQQDSFHSSGLSSFTLPTDAAVTRLQQLFPNNPRLNLYLNAIGSLRGSSTLSTTNILLGADANGVDRGSVLFGANTITVPSVTSTPQWLVRVDHSLSARHQLSFRYIYDSTTSDPNAVDFPGYIEAFKGRDQNFLFSDTYSFNSSWSNEFRFSYGRIGFNFPISTTSVAEAQTLPNFTIPSVSAPGIPTNIPQFRFANNFLFQETQTKLRGNHTFRYGVEFLRQLAKQRPPFNERGSFNFTNSSNGYSGFVNFLEDFSGPSGSTNRNFGQPVYYPDLFRQSYFFQDTWKVKPDLTLTLGLRYENFGQPANGAFQFPAFAGFDPAQFLVPNKVNTDNNNFGPSFGLAWSPSYSSGVLGKVFGDKKGVVRGGYQVSYDSQFNNLLSNIAADTPNTIATSFIGPNAGRGAGNVSSTLPTVAGTPSITNSQTSVFVKDLRSPYTERWSFGFQRELPRKLFFDLSYVGSQSHKLYTNEDLNPRDLNGNRLFPAFGIRRVRASDGNANYNGMQVRLDRRFDHGFQINTSYTWSKTIDSTSEVFAGVSSPSSVPSVPVSQGGLALDRGNSDYDRRHRGTIAFFWDIPGPKTGYMRQVLGGWSLSGITTFQSGAPYTIANGADRNNDGIAADRPDIGNPDAPLNTRAITVATTTCATGFRNPDTLTCVTPNDVHWVQGTGLPNARTVGRNTLFAKGVSNFDVDIFKSFAFTESKKLEFRLETFNIFNHRQYTGIPSASVVGSNAPTSTLPSRFLNDIFVNGGSRTMRVQLKFIF